jgi:hypothetical protein
MKAWWSFLAVTGAALFNASNGHGQDPLNSSDVPQASSTRGPHNDLNIVPIAGGSTDLGIGGGAFMGLSRVKQGYDPYVWNIDAAAIAMFEYSNKQFQMPYLDVYARLVIPRTMGAPLRLSLRPSFTAESTSGYYGMGNASTDISPAGAPSSYFEYVRRHAAMDVLLKTALVDHLAVITGGRYIYNWMSVAKDSKLAADLHSGDAEVLKLIGPTADHSVALFDLGMQWDNRDGETSTHSGQFHELDVRWSPGGWGAFPYRYAQTTLSLSGFLPIWKPRVTLALRAIGDVLFGSPPFYELARINDSPAIGGSNGVRGVPAQRYSGKVKVLANAELRVEIVHFRLLRKQMLLGAVGFFDGGRVWADLGVQRALDGTGIGLKYGVGGGLRVQSGESFVVRVDVAWSPDAQPIGAYFCAGQMF